jgi:N4 gp44-like protein
LAHTLKEHNETEGLYEVTVPIKGSLKGNGIESFFSTVISTEKMPLKDLKDYKNKMLNITEEDEMLGYKHVFQTRLTKKTVGKRIRSPIGMWSIEETYIDNNIGHVLKTLNEYYE